MKRQSMRPPSPSASLAVFDEETGWCDVPRQTMPTQEIKQRRFV
jgi:hypothetical protein